METPLQPEQNQNNWSIVSFENWKTLSVRKKWLPKECMVINQPESEKPSLFLCSSSVLDCFLEMVDCLIMRSSQLEKTGKVLKINHFFLLIWELPQENMLLELSVSQRTDKFIRIKGLAMLKNRLAACIGDMLVALEPVDTHQNAKKMSSS